MKKFIICAFLIFVSKLTLAQDSLIVYSTKRAVKLEAGSNFRDLGGYPTSNGKTVKWGMIFRSADVSKLTNNDVLKLTNLHIKTVCDFRGPDEVSRAADHIPAGVKYINLPAGSESVKVAMNYTTMNTDSMMTSMYSRTDHLKAKYQPLMEQLLDLGANNALMFHCTAGKDRTGIGAAIVLSALGVDKKYIVADYIATNYFWNNSELKKTMAKGMDLKKVEVLMSANPIYIETFLKAIDTKYGSMDLFLKNELELNSDKIAKLRTIYLN